MERESERERERVDLLTGLENFSVVCMGAIFPCSPTDLRRVSFTVFININPTFWPTNLSLMSNHFLQGCRCHYVVMERKLQRWLAPVDMDLEAKQTNKGRELQRWLAPVDMDLEAKQTNKGREYWVLPHQIAYKVSCIMLVSFFYATIKMPLVKKQWFLSFLRQWYTPLRKSQTHRESRMIQLKN